MKNIALTPPPINNLVTKEEISNFITQTQAETISKNCLKNFQPFQKYDLTIPEEADLNDYFYTGTFIVSSNSVAAALLNCPTSTAGKLWCFGAMNNTVQILQHILIQYRFIYHVSHRFLSAMRLQTHKTLLPRLLVPGMKLNVLH